MGNTDVQSAFRLAPLSRASWPWLIMMAKHPLTFQWMFFVDKCLPFGASISCAIFQRFSNALCHIVKVKSSRQTINNYLDDFLFIAYTKMLCDSMIQTFLDTCYTIGVPIAEGKTEWGQTLIVFLGLLLDGHRMLICIPEEKRDKAIYTLNKLLDKKKATVRVLQTLCGYLNFLNRAIYPGRVFMRRMYSKYASLIDKPMRKIDRSTQLETETTGQSVSKTTKILKPYHHIRLDSEFKSDCRIWLKFLTDPELSKVVNRPMIDINMVTSSIDISFFTDASANPLFGYGCIYESRWTYGQWEENFIKEDKPSIEFLELYALCAGILMWENQIKDSRVIVHCDNMGVVGMINSMASTCKKCMHLLRILTLNGLLFSRRITAKYIKSADNILSDALSRMNLARFRKFGPHMNKYPDTIHPTMRSAKQLFNVQ